MPAKKSGKSSADYYKDSPKSLAKKREYQREYNKKKDQVAKRVELATERRKRGIYGKGGGDYDHATKRIVNPSVNRGRTGKGGSPATAGDKRARGGKKK